MVVWAHTSDRGIDPQRTYWSQIRNHHSCNYIDLFHLNLTGIPINYYLPPRASHINPKTHTAGLIDNFGKPTTHNSHRNSCFCNEISHSWGFIHDERRLVYLVHYTFRNHYPSDTLHLWWPESEVLNNLQKNPKWKNQRSLSCYLILGRNLSHHRNLAIRQKRNLDLCIFRYLYFVANRRIHLHQNLSLSQTHPLLYPPSGLPNVLIKLRTLVLVRATYPQRSDYLCWGHFDADFTGQHTSKVPHRNWNC